MQLPILSQQKVVRDQMGHPVLCTHEARERRRSRIPKRNEQPASAARDLSDELRAAQKSPDLDLVWKVSCSTCPNDQCLNTGTYVSKLQVDLKLNYFYDQTEQRFLDITEIISYGYQRHQNVPWLNIQANTYHCPKFVVTKTAAPCRTQARQRGRRGRLLFHSKGPILRMRLPKFLQRGIYNIFTIV